MSADILQLLSIALAALQEADVAHAVMGGCARNAYAEPRATKDLDLVVAADPSKYPVLVEALRRRGFVEATTVGGEEVPPDLTLFRDGAGRRIDVLYAHTEFERQALERAHKLEVLDGAAAPVVAAEDLIVYKVIADRPQDRVDIRDVVTAIEAGGGRIDWVHVETWCAAWQVSDRLRRLREQLG